MQKLPEFSGKPLIENPTIPMIGYLEGKFGEKFLEAYNTVVDEEHDGNKTLKVHSLSDKVLKGSSTYSSVIDAEILRQNGMEKAKPTDIEFARELHNKHPGTGLDTRGCYVDYGIAFRGVGSPNEYQAKNLDAEIKKALQTKRLKNTVVVLSEDLKVVNDENAPDSVRLSLRKGANPFLVPALDRDTNFNKTDKNGMPKPEENGSRISYTIDSGLSGLGLRGGLDLCSYWDGLPGSSLGGRVVAVKR